MKYSCEFCGSRRGRLYYIPPRLAVHFNCPIVDSKPLTCHACGQMNDIFCVYGHDCYKVWLQDEQKYCPLCFNEYLDIAHHSDKIAKEVSKEFLALVTQKHGRSEEIRHRVHARMSGERLYWQASNNCAFNAALGDEFCRQIILRFSYVLPLESIRIMMPDEAERFRN